MIRSAVGQHFSASTFPEFVATYPCEAQTGSARSLKQKTLNHWVVGSIPTRCMPQRQRLKPVRQKMLFGKCAIGTVLVLADHTTGRCMITARHVIDGFKAKLADSVWLRVNAKAGGCEWVHTDLNNWICSEDPSLDVAVHFGCLNDQADHMILDRLIALTPDVAKKLDVGVGDEAQNHS